MEKTQIIISIIIIAISIIMGILYLIWQIKKRGLREVVIDMILKAEEKFEHGQNSEKMKYVIKTIKTILSSTKTGTLLSFFITDENIQKFVQEIFDGLKKALDYVPKEEKNHE